MDIIITPSIEKVSPSLLKEGEDDYYGNKHFGD
jgi:hypothetical protein